MQSAPDQLVIILEKKGRGRGISVIKTWTVRTFKLQGQNLKYYDKDKLKGEIDISGSKSEIIEPSEADNKEYPFLLDTGKEKLILNATNEHMRKKCVDIFNFAANSQELYMKLEEEKQQPVSNQV